MQSPALIEFAGNCLSVLKKSLLAVAPEEGCALLIGEERQSSTFEKKSLWEVKLIWPCRNVWEQGKFPLNENLTKNTGSKKHPLSKENRFVIDPQEQLIAQKWARKRHWKVLGSAHSHPQEQALPSEIDCSSSLAPGLMIILGKEGEIRAWWMQAKKTCPPIEVPIMESR